MWKTARDSFRYRLEASKCAMLISPDHCRAARVLLGWGQEELVERSKVSIATIRRFENGKEVSDKVSDKNRLILMQTFEKAGIIFVFEGEEVAGHKISIGVALRSKKMRKGPL